MGCGKGMLEAEARSYLGRYLFSGEDAFKKVDVLSGGERGRLTLAVLALVEVNFLILDEPTNHLDIQSREILEEALLHFPGPILFVTHDRYLVEKLAELCEVSTRTIQRIEGGEADPRTFTLNSMGNILEFDFYEAGEQNDALWISLLHLSSMISIPLIPLLLWSWKKRTSPAVDSHGKKALDFQLSTTVYLMSLAVIYMAAVPALIGMGLFCTYQGIANALLFARDRDVKYRLAIPFLK